MRLRNWPKWKLQGLNGFRVCSIVQQWQDFVSLWFSRVFPPGYNMVAIALSITLTIPVIPKRNKYLSCSLSLSISVWKIFHYTSSDTPWVTCPPLVQLSNEDWVTVIGLDQLTHSLGQDPVPGIKIRVIWVIKKGNGCWIVKSKGNVHHWK